MLRAAPALAVTLVAFSLPAQAATYTDAEVFFSRLEIRLVATDGFTNFVDSLIEPTPRTANYSMFVDETGTVGVLDPIRQFAGSINTSPTDTEWTALAPGAISGRTASVLFDAFSIEITGNPIAQIRTSGASISIPSLATTIHTSGSFLFGSDVIPFSTTLNVTTNANGSLGQSGQDRILWNTIVTNSPIFSTQLGGVTYLGVLGLDQKVLIPEPGTALLVGLGLAGLTRRRSDRRA